ncbi:hypothetical protein SSX86_009013 [Deinandra increscens subsp. villosa]|uniref:GIL1/IRKI C-terminal domain-containing protein n=1 Tax=Deinandra increscens subsp. villosa TaxID=3103831 RepID=A0AAP0DKA0_9ASTR
MTTATTAAGDRRRTTTTDVSRQEIQSAIAKAMELRSIHAALLQSSSPSNLRFPAASPPPRHASKHSAQDYPVFTPSYDVPRNQTSPGSWDGYSPNVGGNDDLRFLSDYKNPNTSSRILLPPELLSIVRQTRPADDHNSVTNNLVPSPETKRPRSRRTSLGDFKSVTSSEKCKSATLDGTEKHNYSNLVVPMTDSHSSVQSRSKPKSGKSLSWLFPRLNKKKHKGTEGSPNHVESDEASLKDSGIMSIEALKRELTEANERRDAALMEVSEMRSSIGKPVDLNDENVPASNEEMVEGFMQMVSEARSSVNQFCRALVAQINERDTVLLKNVNSILQPEKLSLSSRYSKAVLCHLEAVINQSLYQDFENCVFQKNGSPKLLDPQQERQARFSSFCALRDLSWNEVLRKGTKHYSEEFSRFCDQKMSGIVTSLNWTRPWPEQLLQAFFVAAKCVWLLHLLAFSFSPALGILRVEENRSFDGVYMEDVFADTQRAQNPTRVKVMVMPGFYVQDKVLKCKVVCRYKTAG